MLRISRRLLTATIAASAVAGAAAAPGALAGSLPAQGVWTFDNTPSMSTTAGRAIFKAYLRVTPEGATLYSFDGMVFSAKCRKNGRTLAQPISYATRANKAAVPVRADGTFSATRKVVGDATGVKGTAFVRGAFAGKKVAGRVTVHLHDPVWGDCHGTGRITRDNGTKVG